MKGMADVMGGAMDAGEMGKAMAGMTGMDEGAMDELGMAQMAAQTGLTPGMVASMGAAGMAGMDVTSVMSTEMAGLGSEAIKGMAAMAASINCPRKSTSFWCLLSILGLIASKTCDPTI